MPRKSIPASDFSRLYSSITHELSDEVIIRLADELGDKHIKFLPIAEEIVLGYKNRDRIHKFQPKLKQIRASLKKLSTHANGLLQDIDSLDSDTYTFLHEALLTTSFSEQSTVDDEEHEIIHEILLSELSNDQSLSDGMGLDIEKLDNPDAIKELLSSGSHSRWIALQELTEQIRSEMNWLTILVDNALLGVDKSSKPGPPKGPLHWLAEKTIVGLKKVGIKQLPATEGGIISRVMQILLEEADASKKIYEDRELLPEIYKAIQK